MLIEYITLPECEARLHRFLAGGPVQPPKRQALGVPLHGAHHLPLLDVPQDVGVLSDPRRRGHGRGLPDTRHLLTQIISVN